MKLSVLVFGAAAAISFATQSAGSPITIGGTEFTGGLADFPVTATLLSGTVTTFGSVSCPDGLIGADVDTGCFNLSASDVIRLDFGRTFGNAAGADIYFTDGRFSNDALDFSLDGATYHRIAADDFTDTGVDSVIRDAGFGFRLFAALVDLSDYGFAADGSFGSIWLRGVTQSDPIVVGLLGGTTTPVPVPTALPLLAGALGLLTIAGRRRS